MKAIAIEKEIGREKLFWLINYPSRPLFYETKDPLLCNYFKVIQKVSLTTQHRLIVCSINIKKWSKNDAKQNLQTKS